MALALFPVARRGRKNEQPNPSSTRCSRRERRHTDDEGPAFSHVSVCRIGAPDKRAQTGRPPSRAAPATAPLAPRPASLRAKHRSRLIAQRLILVAPTDLPGAAQKMAEPRVRTSAAISFPPSGLPGHRHFRLPTLSAPPTLLAGGYPRRDPARQLRLNAGPGHQKRRHESPAARPVQSFVPHAASVRDSRTTRHAGTSGGGPRPSGARTKTCPQTGSH